MNEFIDQLKSINWWIGVVVVGLAINLVAAYIKPQIDLLMGRYSKRKREKNEAKNRKRLRDIEQLKQDKHEQIQFLINANYFRLRSISFLLLGILIWLMSEWNGVPKIVLIYIIFKLLVALSVIAARSDMSKSYDYRELVEEARDQI